MELLKEIEIEYDELYLIDLFNHFVVGRSCYNHLPCILYILFTFNFFGIIKLKYQNQFFETLGALADNHKK